MSKKKKGLLASVALPALVLVMTLGIISPQKVFADNLILEEEKLFDIELLLTSSTHSQYELQVSVTNNDSDFDGYVRVMPESNYDRCAYDKEISLAQGTTKQYKLVIPSSGMRSARAKCTVSIVDKKGRELQTETLNNVFAYGDSSLAVGVLTDDMKSLMYVDMGGTPIYLQDDLYSLKLQQLGATDMIDNLDAYNVLLVDQFDTSTLTDEQVEAIYEWVYNGGSLIVGTGEYAKEVLEGLDRNNDLRVDIVETYDQKSGASYMAYNSFEDNVLEVIEQTELTVCVCNNRGSSYDFYEAYEMAGLAKGYGDGSISILYFSFTDPYLQSSEMYAELTSSFIEGVFSTTVDNAASWYGGFSSTDMYYEITTIFDKINAAMTKVHMGIFFFITLIYVAVIGPVAYYILRAKKKQILYWVVVPALSVVMVMLLVVASRFYATSKYRGISVTVADASGTGVAETFLMAFSSGNKEWSKKTVEDTHYIQESSYSYDYSDNYKNRIVDANDGWYIGGNPSRSFDEMYYLLTRDNHAQGSFDSRGVEIDNFDNISGVLTNNTGKDMDFVLVTNGSKVYIVKNVPNGAEVDYTQLDQADDFYSRYKDPNIDQYIYNVIHNAYYDYSGEGTREDVDELSALYFGLMQCYAKGDLVVVGVTSDYEKVLDREVDETAYGCLYTVLK